MHSYKKEQDPMSCLMSFSKYKDKNWDGEGALPIKKETLKNCKKALTWALNIIKYEPSFCPTPNWTISFEWETEDLFAYIEIWLTKYSCYIKGYNLEQTIYHEWSAQEDLTYLWKEINTLL